MVEALVEAEGMVEGKGEQAKVGGEMSLPLHGRGDRLEEDNFLRIVDWLEQADNFTLLHGNKRKNSQIGGKFLSKKTIFNSMLVHLHAIGFSQEVKMGANLGKRFERFTGRYKVALNLKNQTGGGVTIVKA